MKQQPPPAVEVRLSRRTASTSVFTWVIVGVVCFAAGVLAGLGIAVGTKSGLNREDELKATISDLRQTLLERETAHESALSAKQAELSTGVELLESKDHVGTGIGYEYIKSKWPDIDFKVINTEPVRQTVGVSADWGFLLLGAAQNYSGIMIFVDEAKAGQAESIVVERLAIACQLADQSWTRQEILAWMEDVVVNKSNTEGTIVRPNGNKVSFSLGPIRNVHIMHESDSGKGDVRGQMEEFLRRQR